MNRRYWNLLIKLLLKWEAKWYKRRKNFWWQCYKRTYLKYGNTIMLFLWCFSVFLEFLHFPDERKSIILCYEERKEWYRSLKLNIERSDPLGLMEESEVKRRKFSSLLIFVMKFFLIRRVVFLLINITISYRDAIIKHFTTLPHDSFRTTFPLLSLPSTRTPSRSPVPNKRYRQGFWQI